MNLIQNNPYRILGLLVGATAKEQERQVRRLKQFIAAQQEPEGDFSFPTLGSLDRTTDSVSDAASKLNLYSDKMSAALFWFYKGSPITDEPAFDAIKEADLDQVLSIWTKLTTNGEVSQRNASAFNNLGTLYLSGILEGTNTNEAILEHGISLKLKFLESDFIHGFKVLATDENYKTTKKELQLLVLNQVQSEIEKSGGITLNKFLDILAKQEFSAKEDFMKGFVQKPIEQIEKKIEEAKTKRKANKANSINAGKALYDQTSAILLQLKSILGNSDLKFASISDKVSDEILQCGIDYFSYYKDSNTDPGSSSMGLFRKAKTLAVGNIAKQRCEENLKDLQDWIDDKPEREKQKHILDDLKFITSKIERFRLLTNNIRNAREFVDSCKPRLINIKNSLGSSDNYYLKLSSAVANNALGMLITSVNKAQKDAEITLDFTSLRLTVQDALMVSETIGTLDMLSRQREHYRTNHTTLKSISLQLGVSSSSYSSSTKRTHRQTSLSTSSGSDLNFADIFPWIIAVIGIIIGLANGAGWASLLIGFLALGLGGMIAAWFE